MHSITRKPYGYQLIFAENMDEEEMKKWVEESKAQLDSAPPSFGIFVDMRTLKPLSPQAKAVMEEGQKIYKENGMERSVVILNDPIITLQFKDIARKSGIYQWERYIDASSNPNWEQTGIAWLEDQVDPDAK